MDGRKDTVNLIPSPFCERLKTLEAIVKFLSKDQDDHVMGEELNTLVQSVVDNGYLKEKYDPMPFLALLNGEYI